MKNNKCYDSDCNEEECYDPKHYNYICFNPDCDDVPCTNKDHYKRKLLHEHQKNTDFDVFDHREEIDYDEDVEISLCGCPDCDDDKDNDNHSHDHDHHHEDENHDEECNCDNHEDNKRISNINNEDDEEELLAEGKPLIYNRPIQIMLSSGILFIIGHILEMISFNPTITNTIFIISALIGGYQIAISAYKSLIKKHTIGPSLLMCIACISSFIIGHPEEGAAVALLYFIAEFLEDYSEHRSKHSIKSLIAIAPDTACVKVGDTEKILPVDDVNIGDVVIVKPGDKIPLDGYISQGSSSINQASITGESLPVHKEVSDEVFSGTVNEEGYLEITVTKKAKDSVISKIVTLVKRSQLHKSETETLVNKIAKYYTPIMILISVCVACIPPLLFNGAWDIWIYKALSIMVISCPCAFLISTPVGMVSSITAATKKGVLIKGSSYVEEMKNIKAVILDKTGTLTEGKLVLTNIEIKDEEFTKDEIIKILASLEHNSSHPIAKAILNYADENNILYEEITDFKNVAGKGIVGSLNGEKYYAANESLIEGSEFNISRDEINKYSKKGETIICLGNSKTVIGIITVSDKIRDGAGEVISDLKEQGVKTFMLTGDNKLAGEKVAKELGLDYVYTDLLPEDKLNLLDTIRNKFGDVAMVGDGINDAPALARANIGIAMGAAGSEVAIETADIALMQDDISKLPYLFTLSRKTMGIITQNITFAITIKVLFVILATLGLITLMMSVGIGDLGLTLLVILNSFRISRVKDPLF
ncbi:cation-translocating P-type ATPase [uncultured Methanobrevibacter sp.]|uniref:heavy metal translocating P-type ATPase n=1 Tax=uncultured Methanobrevibacter sp. TaxID=253161 RepID=UPI0025DA5DE4|nr:cation-translocating P-type ATPase [uncultured Methanobrevibacter sp.]